MEAQLFKIKINDHEFVIDDKLEKFVEVGGKDDAAINAVPIGKFRYKDGQWFILWDRKYNNCYRPKGNVSNIPLTVGWVEILFLDEHAPDKEYLDLIILLSETVSIIRSRCGVDPFRKSDATLRRWLDQFNKSN